MFLNPGDFYNRFLQHFTVLIFRICFDFLIFCKKLLSLLDHTRVGLADHPERQARRCCDACYGGKSDGRLRHIHREYVKCRTNADGEGVLKAKLNKKVVPYRIFTTSVFDKGQQSFVRNLFDFKQESVVPIITHWCPLENAI